LSLRGLPDAGRSLRGLSLRGLPDAGRSPRGLSLRDFPASPPLRVPPAVDLLAGGLVDLEGGLLPPGRLSFAPDVEREAGRSDVTLDPLRHGSRTWS